MTRKLNTISRTATFSWSPGNQAPMVATGTIAGAVDDSFTNASDLEIFKLDLNPESNNLQSSYKVSTVSRFNTLAWGHSTAEKPNGIIAGGMESGELELWDPSAILNGKSSEDALILRNSTHTGTLKAIDFNFFQTNLLASAGSHGEVFIWDLNNPTTPYTPGARSAKMDDISSVAWNCQVQHILSTASTNGYTVVWDLRNKKEVMTLAHSGQSSLVGAGAISSIAWHPNVATQIVTASNDDSNPIISLWDLRHAHSPEKTLVGHNKGVLDVSWCRQDSDLLISSGKDCKTLCWNPNTGLLNGELSCNTKWTFEVDWCPQNPNLLATSSFDGSINVFSIQGTQETSTVDSSAKAPICDDPFDTALSAAVPSVKPFELTTPPKWLRRPVGASFGFSGKLVTFNNTSITNDTITRTVKIIHVETDPEIVKRSEQLESASKLGVEQLIEDRIQTGDKKDWEAIKTLFSENAREELMKYLGFEKEQVMAAAQDLLNKSNIKSNETTEKVVQASPIQSNTMSNFFGSSEAVSPDEAFFGQVADKEQTISAKEKPAINVAALISSRPFNLYPDGSSDTDHLITRAIVLGDFESAANVCIASERYADALLLAICGGSELLARTQKTYFEKQSKKFAYLRLLEGILEEDLTSIVRDADLSEWSSVLVVLCTFAQSKDFGTLCEILGDRLANDTKMSQHATLFYLVAGNLEKVSKIWIDQFNKEDAEHVDSNTHGSRLQALIEKVTIFRQAIDYEDSALNNAEMGGDYPLSSLYDKYCEYAEFMATQGKLEVALKYISLTPSANPKSKISRGSIVRDRVYHANISQNGQYSEPVFPFEKKQLSSKQEQEQVHQPVILQNPYVQPTRQRNVAPAQPATNFYAPTNVAAAQNQQQHHYSPYDQQNYNTNYVADAYNNQQAQLYPHQQQYGQVSQQNYGPSAQQTVSNDPPPPPLKATGAWNDPPMLPSPKTNNKKKPQYPNADLVPTKRVTTPFSGTSLPIADSPQQQSNMQAPPPPINATPPPPMRGLYGPAAPPPPSSNTTVGYYSAHQQPQQFQQTTRGTPPPPPPPMNAVAPSPMRFPAPPQQQRF